MNKKLKDEWKRVKLEEICEKVQYGYTASATYKEVGPKFLRITDIVPDLIDWDSVPYCEINPKEIDKFSLRGGDIVIARTGATVGYAKYIKGNTAEAVFASYLVRIRLRPDICSRYVGLIIESSKYKNFVKSHMGGAAQPNANAKILTSFEFLLPLLPIQRKIASILSDYDDLIENNTRRIKILEEMAQAIYKEWFVNSRFPGHEKVTMVDISVDISVETNSNASLQNKIPEGWGVKSVRDLVKRLKARNTYTQKDVLSFGNVPVVDQSRDEILGFHNNEPTHYASSTNPIIIFGDHTCKMQIMVEPFSLGPNVIPFISNENSTIYFLFFTIRNLVETREYKRHWNELIVKKVVLPEKRLQILFSDTVRPMTEDIGLLRKKNLNLQRTRDLLLPKLISGEIDVKEIEIHVNGVE